MKRISDYEAPEPSGRELDGDVIESTQNSSRTYLTDGLRSGGSIEYVNGLPFWDEENRAYRLAPLRPANRAQGRARSLGAPGYVDQPDYLPADEYLRAGDYAVDVPEVWEEPDATPAEATETGRRVVSHNWAFIEGVNAGFPGWN